MQDLLEDRCRSSQHEDLLQVSGCERASSSATSLVVHDGREIRKYGGGRAEPAGVVTDINKGSKVWYNGRILPWCGGCDWKDFAKS